MVKFKKQDLLGDSRRYIPNEQIEKLRCYNCKKYLSIFPIYLNPQLGSLCGRCNNSDPQSIRNVAYEAATSCLKFPCANQECLEYFLPSDMLKHEQYCKFKIYDCPTLTNCNWKGNAASILDHFEDNHLVLLLKEGRFEVNFIHCYKENYLYPFGLELFVVSVEFNEKSSTFYISFSYIGSNEFIKNYIYKISFKAANSIYDVTVPKINEKVEVNSNEIRKQLGDPVAIVANIDIQEKEFVKLIIIPKNERTDISLDFLSEIECPICLEYMVPPIYQCLSGHSICQKCKHQVKECPTCKKEFGNTQNYTLEKLTNHIIYPCKNDECSFTAKAREIKKHEENCMYGPLDCPLKDYCDCYWSSSMTTMYDHLKEQHHENILDLDVVNIPFDFENDEDSLILNFNFRLFQLHFAYIDDDIYWEVQLIGSQEESCKYKYEVDVLDTTGNKLRFYQNRQVGPLSSMHNAFDDKKHYICASRTQIEPLIYNQLTYRIRIYLD